MVEDEKPELKELLEIGIKSEIESQKSIRRTIRKRKNT